MNESQKSVVSPKIVSLLTPENQIILHTGGAVYNDGRYFCP